MPLYDYECKTCGYEYIDTHNIDGVSEKICPKCSSPDKKKLISFQGAAKTSTPSWIDKHLRGALQSETGIRNKKVKPIETRDELKAHLKKNNLIPIE